MNPIAYAVLCVVVPAVWAIASFYAFNLLDRRRAKGARDVPPRDYSI